MLSSMHVSDLNPLLPWTSPAAPASSVGGSVDVDAGKVGTLYADGLCAPNVHSRARILVTFRPNAVVYSGMGSDPKSLDHFMAALTFQTRSWEPAATSTFRTPLVSGSRRPSESACADRHRPGSGRGSGRPRASRHSHGA